MQNPVYSLPRTRLICKLGAGRLRQGAPAMHQEFLMQPIGRYMYVPCMSGGSVSILKRLAVVTKRIWFRLNQIHCA